MESQSEAGGGSKDELPPLLRLPLEVRTAIFRRVAVTDPHSDFVYTYTLKPHALAQVNKQLRAEVLPIYYGENRFYIDMPCGDEDDKFGEPEGWEEFIGHLSAVEHNGGLALIKNLLLNFREPVWEDSHNFLFGFEVTTGAEDVSAREAALRIGDDSLDWTDRHAVRAAFNATLKRNCKYYLDHREMRERVPIDHTIAVLLAIAASCDLADRYVELAWDYGR